MEAQHCQETGDENKYPTLHGHTSFLLGSKTIAGSQYYDTSGQMAETNVMQRALTQISSLYFLTL
jgi:hypothetical protein